MTDTVVVTDTLIVIDTVVVTDTLTSTDTLVVTDTMTEVDTVEVLPQLSSVMLMGVSHPFDGWHGHRYTQIRGDTVFLDWLAVGEKSTLRSISTSPRRPRI